MLGWALPPALPAWKRSLWLAGARQVLSAFPKRQRLSEWPGPPLPKASALWDWWEGKIRFGVGKASTKRTGKGLFPFSLGTWRTSGRKVATQCAHGIRAHFPSLSWVQGRRLGIRPRDSPPAIEPSQLRAASCLGLINQRQLSPGAFTLPSPSEQDSERMRFGENLAQSFLRAGDGVRGMEWGLYQTSGGGLQGASDPKTQVLPGRGRE